MKPRHIPEAYWHARPGNPPPAQPKPKAESEPYMTRGQFFFLWGFQPHYGWVDPRQHSRPSFLTGEAS